MTGYPPVCLVTAECVCDFISVVARNIWKHKCEGVRCAWWCEGVRGEPHLKASEKSVSAAAERLDGLL